ncbi:glycosyltransferase, partial [Acinetobacter variabilis]
MSKQPKILLVIRSLSGRGGERSVLTLAQGFYDIGCEVHLLCFRSTKDYDINPNFIYHLIDI